MIVTLNHKEDRLTDIKFCCQDMFEAVLQNAVVKFHGFDIQSMSSLWHIESNYEKITVSFCPYCGAEFITK